MKRIAIIFVILGVLLSGLVFAEESSYEEHGKENYLPTAYEGQVQPIINGPGNCHSKEECMQYCKEHEDECKKFAQEHMTPPPHGFNEAYKKEDGDHPNEYEKGKGDMKPPMMQMMPNNIDPVEMMMYRIFKQAKGMGPEQFMQYCPDAAKMVDEAIKKLQERGVEIKARCDEMQQYLDRCKSEDRCKKMPALSNLPEGLHCEDLTEDMLVNKCLEKSKPDVHPPNPQEQCEHEFVAHAQGCEHLDDHCNEQDFMNKCKEEQEKQCKEHGGNEDAVRHCIDNNPCSSVWENKKHDCEQTTVKCDKDAFIKECTARMQNVPNNPGNSDDFCKQQASQMYQQMKMMCDNKGNYYEMCQKKMKEECDTIEKTISDCQGITSDQIRAKMIEHAGFMCRMKAYKMNGGGMEGVMAQMMATREKMPEDVKMVLDDEAQKLVSAQEQPNKEEGSFWNKLKELFGFVEKQQKGEAGALQSNVQQLEASIQRLSELADQVTDANVKAALVLQVEALKTEKDKINAMAEKKQSGGFFTAFKNVFSGFFSKSLIVH